MKVDKKISIESSISSFKKVKNKAQNIKLSSGIPLKNKTQIYKIDCKNTTKNITNEKPKNFQRINSYLFIGLDKIKNIVFPSTSLKSNGLPTNKTEIKENISIIASPKSTITLLSSQIVSLPKAREEIIKISAKKTIKYKNLFLIISLKVFSAIFIIY
ncbi:MAG: hypothetical protein PHG82_00725 [Candidatus Gracilibacteria bacterium]|nr:hypothetical protein [Candidatus Gracilibacteria bacterium]